MLFLFNKIKTFFIELKAVDNMTKLLIKDILMN